MANLSNINNKFIVTDVGTGQAIVGATNAVTGSTLTVGGASTFAGQITASKNQNATSSFTFQNTDTTGASVRTHLNATAGNRSIRLEAIHSDYSYVVSNNARMYFQTNSGSNNPLFLDGDNATFAGTVTAAGGTMTADTTFNSNIILEGNIFHKDDTNTYFGFNSGSSTDDTIVFATSNVQRLTINSSGTSTFTGNVNISKSGATLRITDTAITNASYNTLILRASNQNLFSLGVGSTTGVANTITINGATANVGIGKDPAKTLDVEGNIRAIKTGGSAAAEIDISSGATWKIRSNPTTGTNSYGLEIVQGGAGTDVKMTIDSGGNVGIGTVSPNIGSDGGTAILTLKNTGTSRAVLNMTSTDVTAGVYAQEAFYNGGVLKTLVQHVGDASTDSGYIKWFTTPSGGSTTERLRIKSNGDSEFKENAEFNKNVFQDIGARGGYIMRPYGADFLNTTASNQTGAIKIILPTGAVTEDDMIKFTVDVYQYAVNKSFSVDVAGYVYQAAGNNTWINCTAIVNAVSSTENYTVRFGDDGTNHCIYIGELNKVWQYPQIICRDFMGGFASEIEDYLPEWDITFATSFGPVVVTLPNNFPQATAPLKGIWTPTLTSSAGGGFTSYSSVGYWQRVGQVVTASFEFTITNLGSASGTVVISNLPVPIAAGNGVKTVVGYGNIAALGQSLSIYHYTALDQIGMNKYDGSFAGTTLATRGTVTYWAEL